jgi:hypothetical protein
MAGRMARRVVPVAGATGRHALLPLGTLAVSWWVVQRGGMAAWSTVVGPLVLVQLAVHLMQWGQRDLVLRMLRGGHVDGAAAWRVSGWSRAMVAVPVVLLAAGAVRLPWPWVVAWAAAAGVAGSFEPLIVRHKRFTPALLADLAGLAAQFAVLCRPEQRTQARWRAPLPCTTPCVAYCCGGPQANPHRGHRPRTCGSTW